MPDHSVDILISEQHFLAVNKPAGLFSQARLDIPSLQSTVTEMLRELEHHSGTPFVGLPHRLDRWTSGVMLLARNQRALKRFGEQFHSRKVGKYYLAVLDGLLDQDRMHWVDSLAKVDGEPRAEIVACDDPRGREASLDIRVLARSANRTLAVIQLHTGRMHQIRIQAASRGIPVVNDQLYRTEYQANNEDDDPAAREKANTVDSRELQPMGLHALRIEFRHPKTAKLTAATAPLPDYWSDFVVDFADAAQAVVGDSRKSPYSAWQIMQASG